MLRLTIFKVSRILPYYISRLNYCKVKSQLPDYAKTIKSHDTITSAAGSPLGKTTASMTVGKKGPIVLQDHQLLEEIAHFVRERIPERALHAKGAGAFGNFEVTKPDVNKYCVAKIFSECGKKTNVSVRFSTSEGNLGSADTVRDVRGFAVKFYTEEGNWDLLCTHLAPFFINDPILFPHLLHVLKRNPQTNCRDPNMFWDFISCRKETLHLLLMLFSDRGIPDGYRFMHGYGVNTYKLINCKGDAYFCKFQLRAECTKNLTPCDARLIAGSDPDYAIRDLYNAIECGKCPSWALAIQVMPMEESNCCEFDPFDPTNVWPHCKYPLIEVGRLTLNQNPLNHFADIEQLAFCPGNMVPGITTSPDKILQGRIFAYGDAQRYRLGVNFAQLPVNSGCCIKNYQRDGFATINNQKNAPNYFPNSFNGPINMENPLTSFYGASGCIDKYENIEKDYFTQPKAFYQKVLSDIGKQSLTENLIGGLTGVEERIQSRMIDIFKNIDCDFAEKIKYGLKPPTEAA